MDKNSENFNRKLDSLKQNENGTLELKRELVLYQKVRLVTSREKKNPSRSIDRKNKRL